MTATLFSALPASGDEITPESAKPEPASVPIPESNSDLSCIVCGRPLTYAGRGRKPQYCEDHRPGSQRTTKQASTRTSKDERLRKELASTLALVGVGVMTLDAYDGLVIIDRSADTVDALMTVAEHNPKVRKALEQILEVSVWAALGTAIAGMAVPIAVHHKMIPLPQDAVERQFLSESTRASIYRLRGAEKTAEDYVSQDSRTPPRSDFDGPVGATITDPTAW